VITQRVAVHYPAESLSLLRVHLELMFQAVEEVERPPPPRLDGSSGGEGKARVRGFRVFDTVEVLATSPGTLTVAWTSGANEDLVADAVLATILQIHAAPASIEALHKLQEHGHQQNAAPMLPALQRAPADAALGDALGAAEGAKRPADTDRHSGGDTASGKLGKKDDDDDDDEDSDNAVERAFAAYVAAQPSLVALHLLDAVRQHYMDAALDADGQLIAISVDGLSALVDCRTRVRPLSHARASPGPIMSWLTGRSRPHTGGQV
jgi:predicted HD phosphohydrolase